MKKELLEILQMIKMKEIFERAFIYDLDLFLWKKNTNSLHIGDENGRKTIAQDLSHGPGNLRDA